MTNTEIQTKSDNKNRKLMLSILFDLIGYASYGIPLVAELTDIVWAPIAGFLLARMYKGTVGTVGGITVFVEELLPGVDFIPTFTLTWIYTYLIKKEGEK
ncbi:hypothetical protein [Flavobacterium suncheonense]|uniref:Uncharacterized protein n=1 Tax=Flavobacterium suncheonense GH29-5 = DSM 17707 TaxID=1121899 RepID=A0A0A2MQS8_9FLAO|nr:hypothetical protein [Flavobacterium suncheonense]KGO90610.1 hypothetical protein Q764_00365 [Flavobacterium suncheonense GH29-5 = DSM 17707]